MRNTTAALGLALALGAPAVVSAGQPPEGLRAPITIELWKDAPPGEPSEGSVGEETAKTDPRSKAVTSITNVTKPTLTVYLPGDGKGNGTAVVVAPGGGYNNLAWDHEGAQVARWLNDNGVAAFVLKYRVPRRPSDPKGEPPRRALMDAQRAVSLVRSHAGKYDINPDRIGFLGFSAGGHLTAWVATNADRRAYDAVDDADRLSCRPDFTVLVYPGGVVRRGTDELTEDIRVTDKTPPAFLAHANDDPVSPVNSVAYYLALKKAGVPAEMHIYASGGHGFGMRKVNHPCAGWPQRCAEWMRDRGLLTAGKGK